MVKKIEKMTEKKIKTSQDTTEKHGKAKRSYKYVLKQKKSRIAKGQKKKCGSKRKQYLSNKGGCSHTRAAGKIFNTDLVKRTWDTNVINQISTR